MTEMIHELLLNVIHVLLQRRAHYKGNSITAHHDNTSTILKVCIECFTTIMVRLAERSILYGPTESDTTTMEIPNDG